PEPTIDQLFDVLLWVALAADHLELVGFKLDVNGDAQLLLADIVPDGHAGDVTDRDAAEGHGRAHAEAGERTTKIENEFPRRLQKLAAAEGEHAGDDQRDRPDDESADELGVGFLGHFGRPISMTRCRPAARPRRPAPRAAGSCAPWGRGSGRAVP